MADYEVLFPGFVNPDTQTIDPVESNINRMYYSYTVYNLMSIEQANLVIDKESVEEAANIDNGTNRVKHYKIFRDWYDGKHGATLSDRQKLMLEHVGFEFSDNFCDVVVDSLVNRLELTGFAYTPENTIATEVSDEMARVNARDILSKRVHHITTKLGDGFLIADFDAESNTVTLTANKPEVVRPHYANGDFENMCWASKLWETEDVHPYFNPNGANVQRLNIYYPDRIEKFYRTVKEDKDAWQCWMDTGDALWPVPWVDESDNHRPLGVAVFHFRNKTIDGEFGVSEIRKTIPQQAMLNKALLDLDLILETQGYPRRWATGVADTEDENPNLDGNAQSKFDDEPGSLWSTEAVEAKFGQFDPADVTGPLKAIELLVQHISASNATPIWLLISGRFPSGESMKMGDSGLSDKASDRMLLHGNVWERIQKFAFNLHNVFAVESTKVDIDGTSIEATWNDTVPRNEKDDILVKVDMVERLGASQRWALTQLGVENVDEVMAERAAELEQAAAAQSRALVSGLTVDAQTVPNNQDSAVA